MGKSETHFQRGAILIILLNILGLGLLIFRVYTPEYVAAATLLEEAERIGVNQETELFRHYNNISAICLSLLCVQNFVLMMYLMWMVIRRGEQEEKLVRKYEKILAEKNNEIMRYAKITSLGRVVTDIIHQWKQPLNSLMLIISNIEDSIREDEDYSAEVLELSCEAKSTVRLLSDTITEFRNVLVHEGKGSAFELDDAVAYATNIFRGRISENNINCTVLYEGNLRVFGKKNMLIQTLMNLIDNALDAIESKVESDDGQSGELRISCKENVEGMEISVWDNGGEIPEEDMENIFRLYYSSKGEKGSGLGLTISRDIIQKDFGGKLQARNMEGGVEFVIFLPRYGGNADE